MKCNISNSYVNMYPGVKITVVETRNGSLNTRLNLRRLFQEP